MEFVGPNPRMKRPVQASQPKRRPFSEWPVWQRIGLLLAVIALGAAAIWYGLNATPAQPRADRYQAVFLENGQVYFGKLSRISAEYVQLEHAYYNKQQALPEDMTDEAVDALAANVALAKVGSETYGPENEMQIRADQILFWQDLATDSKVAQAIRQQP